MHDGTQSYDIQNIISNLVEKLGHLGALSINTYGQTGQNGQIVEWNTKRLGIGPIWPENLDKIGMRFISFDIWEL